MWEIDLSNQLVTLGFSFCLGCLLCVIYDILRSLRKAGFNSFAAVFISDILFWVFSAFVNFIFLMARTCGEMRGYVAVGELAGFLLFRITVSRIVFPMLCFVFNAFKKIHLRFTSAMGSMCLKIDEILSKTGKYTAKKFKTTEKSIKKLLKSGAKVLYTNKNSNDAEYVLNETKT